jgi:ectoine hydroxylase-related dioxygenase (phytanoyl-CoA dioxygenase family)
MHNGALLDNRLHNGSDDFADLDRNGFNVIRQVIGRGDIEHLIAATARETSGDAVRAKSGRLYAVRNLMTHVPAVAELAGSSAVRALVEPVLGRNARPVRAIWFNKTLGANWKVAWHQDLSIAVRNRLNIPGFGPWSIKVGVQHVQPPVEILQQMLTVRLHLDDCGPDNGPLLVLPGSHAAGVLSPDEISAWRGCVAPVECVVAAGGVVLMRPLLLHASSTAAAPRDRRVIHIEYASCDLPGGLRWAEA